MKNNALIKTLALLCLIFIVSSGSGFADDSHTEARRLQNAGEILSLQTILNKIKANYPGTIIEVELEKEKSIFIYEIEILGDDGIVKELYINAKNAEILSIKVDD